MFKTVLLSSKQYYYPHVNYLQNSTIIVIFKTVLQNPQNSAIIPM